MAMSRFAKDLLNRIEILEACVDTLDEELREVKREEREKVKVVDNPNPTTQWGGKDDAEKK